MSAKITEASRKSKLNWDAQHMGTLGTKMKIEYVLAFKKYASERGTTVGALLSGYVKRCLKDAGMMPEE